MTTVNETASVTTTFDVHSPGTGEVVGTYPIRTREEAVAAVARAREAFEWWSGLTYSQRAERLSKFAGVMVRRMQQLAALIHDETGKPYSDASLEAALAVEHLIWAGKNARKILGRKSSRVSLLSINNAASVEYKPLGVIGVIGPWNYPVFTPLGSIVYALAAGNAVVFKPSEFTPGVGGWLVDMFAQVVPEHPVLQLLTGDGSTGAALCRAGVDKIAFTGSTATAKRVMAVCAESLTPMVAECGGKDVLIVDADADLDAAAEAGVWAGMANAGQSCIGTERVYVHERVYDAFLDKLVARAGELRAGIDAEAKIGPITMPKQVEVIRRHIEDALARGGRALVGGADIEGQLVQPTVLVDVPEDCAGGHRGNLRPDADRRQGARYGRGRRPLERHPLRPVGSGVLQGPGPGAGRSAAHRNGQRQRRFQLPVHRLAALRRGRRFRFGRIHGPDGLREFTYAHAVARQRFAPLMALTTFARTAETDKKVATMLTLLHGRK